MGIPQRSEKFQRISAKEQIYQTLRDWIIDGTLAPGEKLLDAELSAYFSVSRTPIREAFQLLEAQKLVQVKSGKSTTVTQMDMHNVQELYLPLAYIQGLAAEIACIQATDSDICRLEELNAEFAKAVQSGETKGILEADTAFHDQIVQISQNTYLQDFCRTLFLHVRRIEHTYFQWTSEPEQSYEAHKQIIKAIKLGDKHRAGELMKSNWLNTMTLYEQLGENEKKMHNKREDAL